MSEISVDECGIFKSPCVSSTRGLERFRVRDLRDCLGKSDNASRSRHPHMESPYVRSQTFALWPAALHPRPEALVDAGFFYSGQGDRCVCYSCGIGLKDWEVTDDPWIEHKTHYPQCLHILKESTKRTIPSKISPSSEISEPSQSALPEALLCKVCFLKQMCVTFLPCKHVSTCESCANCLTNCPVCRESIKSSFKVYLQ